MEIDNKWVVPYCPLLSKIFNAHINVECCNSVKSIKYICNYINKGSDQAVFRLERQGMEREKVAMYQTSRYISTNEAVWRILDFPIHQRYHPVEHLCVNLGNGQHVYFTEDSARDRVAEPPKTILTAKTLPGTCSTVTYHDIISGPARIGSDASKAPQWWSARH